MTKTLFIDSVQTVKKTMVIFISIVFFTILCVALYTGMEWSTASMPQSVQESMEDADLYDIRMLYGRSLTEADLQKIAEIDGVDEVTGSRMGYETFVHHGNRYVQARILKITDDVNVPVTVSVSCPDENGYIYLTGRKKDLIILSNGKNVSPEELEGMFATFPYIRAVRVYEEDGRITGEFALNKEQWPDAEERLKKDVLSVNRSLPKYKNIVSVKIGSALPGKKLFRRERQ